MLPSLNINLSYFNEFSTNKKIQVAGAFLCALNFETHFWSSWSSPRNQEGAEYKITGCVNVIELIYKTVLWRLSIYVSYRGDNYFAQEYLRKIIVKTG